MSTDEEKSRLVKLLQDLEVPEHRVPERCQGLLRDLMQNVEPTQDVANEVETDIARENPYVPDKELLEENERKLRELLLEEKRTKREPIEEATNIADPKRPWRTNSCREKLLRVDCDLKRHLGRAADMIEPLNEGDMQQLVKSCREDVQKTPPVGADRLRETVDEARRSLPNFQYRRVDNTTATSILPEAHEADGNKESCGSGEYIPRPDTTRCFLRSLGELRNLRLLALEYGHVADGTGSALMFLLPVLKRPNFRLQLLCGEAHIPGRADPSLGCGGQGVPDYAWRRVAIACPDLFLAMVFYRLRDYDHVRRFLTASIPLREAHLHQGIQLDCESFDIGSFVRHIEGHYASTLVSLSIHQRRGTTFPLRRTLERLPSLVRFHYVGVVEERDLREVLILIACGVCYSKSIHLFAIL
ncbi:unnamed protein product, partial [Iphiclides podalirius]